MQPSNVTSSGSSVVRPPTQNQNRASLHCASSGSISKPLTGAAALRLRPSLQSQSAGVLLVPPSHKSSGSDPKTTQIYNPRKDKGSASNSADIQPLAMKLESNSQTSLQSSESNFRTFKAPLRTSLSSFQSKALAAFDKDNVNKHLLTKGALSQSSPLLQVQAVPSSSRNNELISISTDNLQIQKQMRNARDRNRGSVACKKNPLVVSHRSTKPNNIQSSCTEGDTVSVDAPDNGRSSPAPNGRSNPALPASSAISVPMNSSATQQVRGSFTLDKQHTYASASAAGLPIINNKDKLSVSVGGVPQPLPVTTTGQSRTNSGAMMLTNLLQLHHGGSTYTLATQKQPIPSDVQELRVNLRSFITSLQSESVHMEREAKIQRLKLYQPNKARNGDRLSCMSVVVEGTAPSASEPVVTQNKTMDADLIRDLNASVSLPDLHIPPHHTVTQLQRNPTSSLEQFERDELLIQLQTSPEHHLENGAMGATAGAHQPHSMAPEAANGTKLSLQQLPLSPIASNGQVFIEQTPDHHYSTDKPEVPSNPWIKPSDTQV